jgi:type I restriction enzyme, S subunit
VSRGRRWPTPPLGSLVQTIVPARDKPTALDGPIPWLRIEDFDGKYIFESKSGQGVTEETVLAMSLRVFPAGTVVCTCSCDMGTTAIVKRALITNQTFIGLVPRPGLTSEYLFYALQAVRPQLNATATGAIQQYLSRDDFRSLRLPIPPERMQRAIADYLDAETARIDALIAKKGQMLKLLDERRLEDVRWLVGGSSGLPRRAAERVHWLGDVPSEWPVLPLRRVARLHMGTTFPHAFQGEPTGDLPFVKVADFESADEMWRVRSAANWIGIDIAKRLRARVVPAQSVLFARVGAALLLNQRRLTTRPCVVDDNVRALEFSVGDPRYWLQLLSLVDLAQFANPGPVPSVSEDQVMSIPVPVPPEDRQRVIANELDRVGQRMSRIRMRLGRQMSLLGERRTALVDAVITGRLQVPGAAG